MRVTLVALLVLLALPAAASAATWQQSTTVYNQTASGANNCNQALAPGNSCISLYGWKLTQGTTWQSEPWQQVAGAFGSWNGADTWTSSNDEFDTNLYTNVAYTLPDDSAWYISTNVLHNYLIGAGSWFVSCQAPNGSSYACQTAGTGDDDQTNASVTFLPLSSTTQIAAGQTCAGQDLAGGQTVDCMATGQFGPMPAKTMVLIYNPGPVPVTATATGSTYTSTCDAAANGGTCNVATDSAGAPLTVGPSAGQPTSDVSVQAGIVTSVQPDVELTAPGGETASEKAIDAAVLEIFDGDDAGGEVVRRRGRKRVKAPLKTRRQMARAHGRRLPRR